MIKCTKSKVTVRGSGGDLLAQYAAITAEIFKLLCKAMPRELAEIILDETVKTGTSEEIKACFKDSADKEANK